MKTLKIKQQITFRETDAIEKYLKEIARIELLTTEEEDNLAQKIQKGDVKALEKLVNSNLRFVISVAKQYQNKGLTLPDLISEGNIGLIKAANRFDSTKGFKFISYAVWWIRQTILQAIAENARIVRLPVNKVGMANKVNKMFVQLMQKFEREPTADEIAEELSLKPDLVKELLESTDRTTYFDSPISNNEDGLKLIDIISNEKDDELELQNNTIKEQITDLLKVLPRRDSDILKMYYGIDLPHKFTLEEIASKFSLTRERIRQIKTKAMKKLKSIY